MDPVRNIFEHIGMHRSPKGERGEIVDIEGKIDYYSAGNLLDLLNNKNNLDFWEKYKKSDAEVLLELSLDLHSEATEARDLRLKKSLATQAYIAFLLYIRATNQNTFWDYFNIILNEITMRSTQYSFLSPQLRSALGPRYITQTLPNGENLDLLEAELWDLRRSDQLDAKLQAERKKPPPKPTL